jgi:hypothetical protein
VIGNLLKDLGKLEKNPVTLVYSSSEDYQMKRESEMFL